MWCCSDSAMRGFPGATWLLLLLILLFSSTATLAVRCYVCGGHTGRSCEDISHGSGGGGRKSPYVRPSPLPASDGARMWEVCNDLINNRGCIKQVVNNVVLLRACWMQATDKCLVDGDATVCTCTQDLCNHAASEGGNNWLLLLLLVLLLVSRTTTTTTFGSS